ncbi:MAG TPA: PDZ domain-containing protein, partial [Tissierellaceae bacterium]|nr:PDZ domain-containing protein [Tissierellaceae bacterium]
HGIIILQIHDKTPAQKAGIMANDIITKIDDIEVENMQTLKKSLYKYRHGDKAVLTIVRNREEMEVEIIF